MRKFVLFIFVMSFVFCSSAFAEISDIDKTVKETGKMYERTYKALWSQLNMHTKLLNAVYKGFDEQTKDLMWGTTGLSLIFSAEVKENIYTSVMFSFDKDYEQFSEKVAEAFGFELNEIIEDFYKVNIAKEIGAIRNPMARGFLRENAVRVIKNGILENVLKLSDSDKNLFGGGFASHTARGAIAAGALLGRSLIVKAGVSMAKKAGMTALAKGLGAKLGAIISGPVGWAVLATWTAAEVNDAIWSLHSAPARIKAELLNTIELRMTTDGIQAQWEEMSSDVKSTFEQVKADIAIYVGISEQITEHKGLTESSKLLTGEQSEKLGMKLSELQSGGKVDIDILLNNVDRMIREQVASEDSKK